MIKENILIMMIVGMLRVVSGHASQVPLEQSCLSRQLIDRINCAFKNNIAMHEDEVENLPQETVAALNAYRDKNGLTLLMLAMEFDNHAVMQYLYNVGVKSFNVKVKNRFGATALMHAASKDKVLDMKLLVTMGADVNARADDGATALTYAAYNNQWQAIKFLCKKGADVNLSTETGVTPLICATERGCYDSVTCLLAHEADVDIATQDGWTALICAADNGHNSIVESLITHGANLNLSTKTGLTALVAAERHQYDTITAMLTNASLKKYDDKDQSDTIS